LTPVTDDSFQKWKTDRKARQQKEDEERAKQKADAYKKFRAGMKSGMAFSGKELFEFNPEMAKEDAGDEDGAAMDFYEREESDHEGEENEPQAQYLGEDGGAVDDIVTDAKGKGKATNVVVSEDLFEEELDGLDDDDDDDEDDE
jgi:hypothetical protein